VRFFSRLSSEEFSNHKGRQNCVQDDDGPKQDARGGANDTEIGEVQCDGSAIDKHAKQGWAWPASDAQADQCKTRNPSDKHGRTLEILAE
jgi:hypothetical protein